MKITKYISVYGIIRQVYRDFGIDDISESDAIEWAADALEQMSIKETYTINTAFLEVNNFSCELPDNCMKVIQVAKHECEQKLPKNPHNIIYEVLNDECGCNTIEEECGCGTKTVPNPHLRFCSSFLINYGVVFNVATMGKRKAEWIEVEPSGNNFFNAGTCKGGNCDKAIQYKAGNGKLLFSFEKGIVAVSYVTLQLDEDGMPMVPDDVSAREAVTRYIMMKIAQRYWFSGREGYREKMMKLETDWHWYCKQFKAKAAMPDEDEYKKIARQELRLFPHFKPDFIGSINLCDSICGCSVIGEERAKTNPCCKENELVFLPREDFPSVGDPTSLYIDIAGDQIYRFDGDSYVVVGSNGITLDDIDEIIDEINGGGR